MRTCDICGEKIHKPDHLGTGYGTTRDGETACYECCASIDQDAMRSEGRITLYLSEDAVTNWPGTLRFPTHRRTTGRHNMARVRYDVWFLDHEGDEWHGVQYGDNTQICHCKRRKTTEA
jgi:hypothetical protein